MLNNFLPYLYGLAVCVLLIQAARVMFRGVYTPKAGTKNMQNISHSEEDRTGQVTIHPEILNQDGKITDEDLLTVRFSRDGDPPKSSGTPT
ncbi:DUF2973 domain-containing protein [Prochlorococcus sp. MIT 1223]|uniref:DUF2973 domain-containing protein n=1 Tax=Prochlorococcus sp. MIT 1223 TaxID=3096217 RepID=UPI002A764C9A|nr:DUF2973 domain-containing protein [Prochlorococcus sp. MIT 1223]